MMNKISLGLSISSFVLILIMFFLFFSQTPKQQNQSIEIEKIQSDLKKIEVFRKNRSELDKIEIKKMQSDLNKIKCLTIYWNYELMFPEGAFYSAAGSSIRINKLPYINEHRYWYISNCIPSISSDEIRKFQADLYTVNPIIRDDYFKRILATYETNWNSNYPRFWNSYNEE